MQIKAKNDAEKALAAKAYELEQREEVVSRKENKLTEILKAYHEQAQKDAENIFKAKQRNLDEEWTELKKEKNSYAAKLKAQSLDELSNYKTLIFFSFVIVATIFISEIASNFKVFKFIASDMWKLLTCFLEPQTKTNSLWVYVIKVVWSTVWRWTILYIALWGLLETSLSDWDGILWLVLRIAPIIVFTVLSGLLGAREMATCIECTCLLYGVIKIYKKIR